MKTKKETKLFTNVECYQEATYLRHMHQSGWKLVRVGLSPILIGRSYLFEAVEPEEVTYLVIPKRLATRKQLDAQIKANWEEVYGSCQTLYLRKVTNFLEPGEMSKMKLDFQRIKQLVVSQFLPYGLIFISILLPRWLRGDLFRVWWSAALFMLLNILYVYLLVRSLYFMRKVSRES